MLYYTLYAPCGASYVCINQRGMKMKANVILLATLLLAACGQGNDSKPMLDKERQTLA